MSGAYGNSIISLSPANQQKNSSVKKGPFCYNKETISEVTTRYNVCNYCLKKEKTSLFFAYYSLLPSNKLLFEPL